MRIRLNGRDREVEPGATVETLLEALGLPGARLAVERNGEVVPRAELGRTRLCEGDILEVVHFVGGG